MGLFLGKKIFEKKIIIKNKHRGHSTDNLSSKQVGQERMHREATFLLVDAIGGLRLTVQSGE